MSVIAQLFIGDHKYKLKGCSFSFIRSTSKAGYPISHVINGRLNCILSFPSDTGIFKMIVQGNELDGTVLFKNSISTENIKRLHFKGAVLVYYNEVLSDQCRIITFTLTFKELRLGKAHYKLNNLSMAKDSNGL